MRSDTACKPAMQPSLLLGDVRCRNKKRTSRSTLAYGHLEFNAAFATNNAYDARQNDLHGHLSLQMEMILASKKRKDTRSRICFADIDLRSDVNKIRAKAFAGATNTGIMHSPARDHPSPEALRARQDLP